VTIGVDRFHGRNEWNVRRELHAHFNLIAMTRLSTYRATISVPNTVRRGRKGGLSTPAMPSGSWPPNRRSSCGLPKPDRLGGRTHGPRHLQDSNPGRPQPVVPTCIRTAEEQVDQGHRTHMLKSCKDRSGEKGGHAGRGKA